MKLYASIETEQTKSILFFIEIHVIGVVIEEVFEEGKVL